MILRKKVARVHTAAGDFAMTLVLTDSTVTAVFSAIDGVRVDDAPGGRGAIINTGGNIATFLDIALPEPFSKDVCDACLESYCREVWDESH